MSFPAFHLELCRLLHTYPELSKKKAHGTFSFSFVPCAFFSLCIFLIFCLNLLSARFSIFTGNSGELLIAFRH